jgi:hypothetical protein
MPRHKAEDALTEEVDSMAETTPPRVHPALSGYLLLLPKRYGDVWPPEARQVWLQGVENLFKQLYKDAPPPT